MGLRDRAQRLGLAGDVGLAEVPVEVQLPLGVRDLVALDEEARQFDRERRVRPEVVAERGPQAGLDRALRDVVARRAWMDDARGHLDEAGGSRQAPLRPVAVPRVGRGHCGGKRRRSGRRGRRHDGSALRRLAVGGGECLGRAAGRCGGGIPAAVQDEQRDGAAEKDHRRRAERQGQRARNGERARPQLQQRRDSEHPRAPVAVVRAVEPPAQDLETAPHVRARGRRGRAEQLRDLGQSASVEEAVHDCRPVRLFEREHLLDDQPLQLEPPERVAHVAALRVARLRRPLAGRAPRPRADARHGAVARDGGEPAPQAPGTGSGGPSPRREERFLRDVLRLLLVVQESRASAFRNPACSSSRSGSRGGVRSMIGPTPGPSPTRGSGSASLH